MNISNIIKEKIKEAVKNIYSIDVENFTVEHPNVESWGDYATNVALVLAKNVKQNPVEIAKKLSYELNNMKVEMLSGDDGVQKINIVEKVEFVAPGFINFTLSPDWLHYVLTDILLQAENYGSCDFGGKKKILIEFSNPNPNKPLHIGHARNNFFGDSIANLHLFCGYDVIKANYINDWGTHICKAMLMYKKYGENKQPDKKPDHFVGEFYSMYERHEQDNESIKEEVSDLFRKLEAGDKATTDLWNTIVSWSMEGWHKTYSDEKISFDVWLRQHNYKDTGKEIVQIALDRGIAEKDESGAVIARLSMYDIPDKVLLRADGTSVYSTQDLQMAKDNIEEYGLDKRIYVVDYRQSDYFNQLFKILEILGFSWAKTHLYHMAYGIVELPEGKMSSRKGLVVNADDVYENLIKVENELVDSNLENRVQIVNEISMAAFKYALLKYDPLSNIVFRYDEVTQFVGNTGPYLLYTRARANSVLEKAGFVFDPNIFEYDMDQFLESLDIKGLSLVRYLYRFPEVVLRSTQEYTPSILCNYLFELSQRFNTFYNDVPILSAPNEQMKNTRLLITKSVFIVLSNGLKLLGIPTPSKM